MSHVFSKLYQAPKQEGNRSCSNSLENLRSNGIESWENSDLEKAVGLSVNVFNVWENCVVETLSEALGEVDVYACMGNIKDVIIEAWESFTHGEFFQKLGQIIYHIYDTLRLCGILA